MCVEVEGGYVERNDSRLDYYPCVCPEEIKKKKPKTLLVTDGIPAMI
jgi:hypothetical protein